MTDVPMFTEADGVIASVERWLASGDERTLWVAPTGTGRFAAVFTDQRTTGSQSQWWRVVHPMYFGNELAVTLRGALACTADGARGNGAGNPRAERYEPNAGGYFVKLAPGTQSTVPTATEGHRRLHARWTIAVCPACNARADEGTAEHTTDCPNRGRDFYAQTVRVIPEDTAPRMDDALDTIAVAIDALAASPDDDTRDAARAAVAAARRIMGECS